MDIKEKLKILPKQPGCYLMKDINNKVIYVGKAKNLFNRVRSYFIGSHNAKTTLLVQNINDFEFVVTSSELESLILEINLIKKYDPKYNIKLTDDKTYPYITITDEKYPKVITTRRKIKGKVYGPYPNVLACRETVDLINKVYPFRKCNKLPNKVCLYYHLNQCLAPCVNKDIDYNPYIKKTRSFLNGNNKEIIKDLEEKMNYYSDKLEYERAIEYRNLINSINQTTEKQKIILTDLQNRDIIGYYYDNDDVSIQIFFMRKGKIIQTHKDIISYVDNPIDNIINYISQFYLSENHYIPKEILIRNLDLSNLEEVIKTKFITPLKGEKKKLLDLAFENAKIELESNKELTRNKLEKQVSQVDSLKSLLKLDYLRRIECFDNSHIFGSNPVSAMVVYIDGKPSKNDYRKYVLKTITKPDDYKAMEEVIYRRYYKVLIDNLERPDLIIIDGGLGQVNVCLKVLNDFNLKIPVIGLKKDNHHKTHSIIYNNKELPLSNKMPYYKLLLDIQEEVHRFAITFHRKTRSKLMYESVLDDIKGIGKKRKTLILKTFKNIDEIKNATYDDYKKIGINKDLVDEIKNKF